MFKKISSFVLCFAVIFVTVTALFASDISCGAEAAKKYTSPYYYGQLDDEAKAVYSTLKNCVQNCDKSINLRTNISQDDFNMISELLIFHDPVTFNLKKIEAAASSGSVKFNMTYNLGREEYKRMLSECEKEAGKILSELTDDLSTYRKIQKIHDLIIERTEYDLDSKYNDSIYGTLVMKKSKCDGYSKTFSYICGLAGIRTATVIGYEKGTDDLENMHMWNKVYYNKNWYNVDLTWDDPMSNLTDNMTYNHFMVSDKENSRTHTENGQNFTAPKASDSSKDYFKVNKRYAEDFDSAKSILSKQLLSAASKGKTKASFKCGSKEVYDKMKKYILDDKNVRAVLKNTNNKVNNDLIYDFYSQKLYDDQYVVTVYIFYYNTDFKQYFTDKDKVSKSTLKTLNKYGIK